MTTNLPSKTSAKKPAASAAVAAVKPAVAASVKSAAATKAAALKSAGTKAAVVAPSVRSKLPAKPAVKAKPSVPVAFPKSAPEPVAIAEVKEKIKKAKLVRDSFTMPETEYAVLGEVKKNCLKAGLEVKKSELLRIGVALIRDLDPAALKAAVAALSPLKPGRPRKEK